MSGGIILTTVPKTDVVLDTLDLLGSNVPYLTCEGVQALTSGTTRFSALPLYAGDIVSELLFAVSVVAGTVTTIKAGLYGTSGNRLAVSNNTATAFDALGPVASFTMTTPYTVPTTGIYYAAVLSVASVPGTLHCITGQAGKGTGFALCGTEAGQTDLDATATITAANAMLWVGYA